MPGINQEQLAIGLEKVVIFHICRHVSVCLTTFYDIEQEETSAAAHSDFPYFFIQKTGMTERLRAEISLHHVQKITFIHLFFKESDHSATYFNVELIDRFKDM